MKKLLCLIPIIGLVACDTYVYVTDKKLKREVFNECMTSLPDGPTVTSYNDWAEVVNECNSYAYSISTERILKRN